MFNLRRIVLRGGWLRWRFWSSKQRSGPRVRVRERSKESLRAEVVALQTQLKEREQQLQARDFSTKELEQGLANRVRDLESQLRDKGGLLESREARLRDVRSEMDHLGQRMAQTEALAKQAESSAVRESE